MKAEDFTQEQRKKIFDQVNLSAQSTWLAYGLDFLLDLMNELRTQDNATGRLAAKTWQQFQIEHREKMMDDPNFFPMSKIPDLVWQLQKRTVSYDMIRKMKDERKFLAAKEKGRFYVQVDSLEEWLNLEPGTIRSQYDHRREEWKEMRSKYKPRKKENE